MAFSNAEAASKNKTIASADMKSQSSPNYSSNNFAKNMSYEGRPGVGVLAGYFTFGANLEAKYGFKIASNTLFVGIETGYLRTSIYSDNAQSISATSFPITPSATFEMPINKNLKLYAGTSLGVSISTATRSFNNDLGFADNSVSSTSGLFVWKFRPGMVIADQFVAELPIGTIDGNFYFVPNVGMRF